MGAVNSQPMVTETERVVADIWSDVLDLPCVSAEENFFDLGGHSVLLHAVRDRLTRDLGRDIELVDLFDHPTVRSLAGHIDGTKATGAADHAGLGGTGARRLRARRRRGPRD